MYLTIHQHLRLGYITETTTVVSNLVKVLSQNQINLYQMTCALFRLLCRSWLYIYTFNILNIQNPVSAIVRGQYCFAEPAEMFGRCHWRLGTLIHPEVLQLLNNLITTRKRSLRRLCFYTCLSVHRGGVVSQHALQVVSQHALQVSGGCIPACLAGFQAPPKGELEGFGQGGSPGPQMGSIPACTDADPLADGYCCERYASYWNALLLYGFPPVSKNRFTSLDSFLSDTPTKWLDFDKVNLSGISHVIYSRWGKVPSLEFKSQSILLCEVISQKLLTEIN